MMPSVRHPDLEGRSVLITGGGSGIGAALTEGFVRQGARVAFIDIAREPSVALCERLDAEHQSRPLFLEVDLRNVEALREAADRAAAAHGPITVLVNNAGWDDRHAVAAVTPAYWDGNHAINLRPQFFAAQAVAAGMKAAGGGAIVNFTSIAWMINGGGYPAYAAAKAGVVGLTKSLARDLGRDGIRVNAIAPGWVMTERQRELWVTEESLAAFLDKQCLPREIEPGDMVGPCLFLASDAARMMTAQTMIVDGGVV